VVQPEYLPLPRSTPVVQGDPHVVQHPPHGPAGTHVAPGPHGPAGPHGADGPSGPEDNVPHEGRKLALPPYIIEPPDVLLIEFTRGVAPRPLRGEFLVGPDGTVNLGTYGQVRVGGLTVPQARDAIAAAL